LAPGHDELRPFGVGRCQLRTGRRGWFAPVMRIVPLRGADLSKEALHLVGAGAELSIEVPRVPIEQDTAQVEHHGVDGAIIFNVRTHRIYVRTTVVDVHIRHQLILQSLEQHSEVQVSTLAMELDCSEMTVRRDLEALERIGGLRRVHGGAVRMYLSAEEAPYGVRALESTDRKAAIGAAAVSLLAEGETVILDGGTTVMEVARALHDRRMTVMPLALRPIFELDGCPGIKLLLPGGEVRPNELSLIGSLTECAFSELRFDTFVMGICGIDPKAGVTTHLLAEAAVKRAAARTSRRVIAVADGSKLGQVAIGHVCDLSDLDILVTDDGADQRILDELILAGVDVRRI